MDLHELLHTIGNRLLAIESRGEKYKRVRIRYKNLAGRTRYASGEGWSRDEALSRALEAAMGLEPGQRFVEPD